MNKRMFEALCVMEGRTNLRTFALLSLWSWFSEKRVTFSEIAWTISFLLFWRQLYWVKFLSSPFFPGLLETQSTVLMCAEARACLNKPWGTIESQYVLRRKWQRLWRRKSTHTLVEVFVSPAASFEWHETGREMRSGVLLSPAHHQNDAGSTHFPLSISWLCSLLVLQIM